MATPQQPARNTEANIRKAAEAIAEVLQMKQEFIRCHDSLANKTYRLVELLGQAESRGYLLEDSLTLVDTVHWLHNDRHRRFAVQTVPANLARGARMTGRLTPPRRAPDRWCHRRPHRGMTATWAPENRARQWAKHQILRLLDLDRYLT
jgi:hypothetical protein